MSISAAPVPLFEVGLPRKEGVLFAARVTGQLAHGKPSW